MPRYSVLIACNISAYKTVEVQADSEEQAEQIVEDSFTADGWDSVYANDSDGTVFEPEWSTADDLRMCEGSTHETVQP